MKKIALGLFGVLVVALAVAVAKQLSSEAMAVIVGIVCGIGASIPTALVMLFLLSREEKREERREEQGRAVPTVMIVSPPAQYYPPLGQPFNAGGRQYYLLDGQPAKPQFYEYDDDGRVR